MFKRTAPTSPHQAIRELSHAAFFNGVTFSAGLFAHGFGQQREHKVFGSNEQARKYSGICLGPILGPIGHPNRRYVYRQELYKRTTARTAQR